MRGDIMDSMDNFQKDKTIKENCAIVSKIWKCV